MDLDDLEIYQLARELSGLVWDVFVRMDWETRKVMGTQWITAVDSVGANIAEGFGRFHYLDRNKFNYNARASLVESIHWTELMKERKKLSEEEFRTLKSLLERLHIGLNNFIKSTKGLAVKK